MGLDPASWAVLGAAALGAGGTAYQAKRSSDASKAATEAADRQAKMSQTQGEAADPNAFRRRRRAGAATGFDAQTAAMTPGAAGLLGS